MPAIKQGLQEGFTLVEIVVVIVLLGIVGVVLIPRFLEPSAFNDVVARDGLLATIRAAQQAALGRSAVTFEIDQSVGGGRWVFTARSAGVPIQSFEISTDNVALTTGAPLASTDTCATVPGDFDDALDPGFALTFGSMGELTEFSNGSSFDVDNSFNGVRICVNARVDTSVCVSPGGYAYAGNCDD